MTKQERILQLKKEKDAVILAHYYVSPEVQEIADFIGDSYFLSKKAMSLKNKIIVFCGVSFMGESGKILNKDKIVLMPEKTADCPMAHMVLKDTVENARKKYPDLAVVCYINSTAEIKGWSDVCVTSANAVKVVKKLPNKHILFIPDKNLAHYVAKQVPEKEFIYNEGFCPIHEYMKVEEVAELKEQHKEALVLVHPECRKEVLELADYIGSTSGIIEYAKHSDKKEFIIGTEMGVLYALQKTRPDAIFYFPKTEPICENMKKITLDHVIHVMESNENAVQLTNQKITMAAEQTLIKMLELSE